MAQMPENERTRMIFVATDTITLDTLSIIPGSVLIEDAGNNHLLNESFEIDYAKSILILKKETGQIPLKIHYKVFPVNFSREYSHKSKDLIHNNASSEPFSYNPFAEYKQYDNQYGELEKRGSISRGVSFGNNQDAIVNSNLNLQLSGKISDNMSILAAISDNNIPVQPDGNTQQIQEFDKVYIQLFSRSTKITAGDFVLAKPAGEYLVLNKKAQGLAFETKYSASKKWDFRNGISAAAAKGKYCRQEIGGVEGNQGPYKIKGCSNETHIVILAGSERVYIDGELMIRGAGSDYVIDYNMAELTFTPQRPINKDKRIIIEFEYSERNYARFLVSSTNEFVSEKSRFWLNIYSESDAKNQPVNQQLSDPQKERLSQIGDSLNLAWFENVKDTMFTNDLVLYKKLDTVSDGLLYRDVYVYSTDPDSARYKLGFSFVGENNGNYMPEATLVNGKVYRWKAPVAGVPQGSYEPVILLVTPKAKQVMTFGGELKLSKKTNAGYEFGVSNNDLNTFSSANAEDNIGYAFNARLVQAVPFRDSAHKSMVATIRYSMINRYFEPVERFREAEFDRDWNLGHFRDNSDEHLGEFILNGKAGKSSALFSSQLMKKGYDLQALKNNLTTGLNFFGFELKATGSLLNTDDPLNKTQFIRDKADFSHRLFSQRIGIRHELENNIWKSKSEDSLLINSYSYNQFEAYVESDDSLETSYFIRARTRDSYLPETNSLTRSSNGKDFQAGFQSAHGKAGKTRLTVNYRSLTIADSTLSDQKPENTMLCRVENNLRLLQGAVTTSTFYEFGSGLEMKREYSYIEVAQGQGVYTWNDYNGNGIKELDEFEIAAFQDQANYIRVLIPGTDYIKTNVTQFNQLLSIKPPRAWSRESGLKSLLSRFSDNFAFRVNSKNTAPDFVSSLNPLSSYIEDSSIISLTKNIRNTFSFNKLSSVFGLDFIYQSAVSRILLVNGTETRNTNLFSVQPRWNITPKLLVANNYEYGKRSNESVFLSAKNFEIEYFSGNIKISFQPNNTLRTTISYLYSDKKNLSETEVCRQNNLGAEIKYNSIKKGSVAINANYILIEYNADWNTAVAYEMLAGLMPGKNATWTVLFQRRMNNNLQLNLTYNGRVSEDSQVVHLGGIQLRAFF